ncbi:MAG: sigma 54-interacting transcriptional regulator [Pseudomonadota bacterium]
MKPLRKTILKKPSLRDEVDLYERVFDSVQNGIMITDPSGIITHMNKPYGRFLNIDPAAQVGRHCTEVVENTRMHIVGRTGKAEINHIQEIKGQNIVVQRIPVRKNGKVMAVFGLVMFSDLREVTQLAKKIGDLESKVKLYEEELLSLRSTRYTFESIIGDSPAMTALKDEALCATSNSFPVLISGECGTGKELFAQAIHHSSARRLHPFVRINCAAIPRDLLESELFGYDRGAFTGARTGGKPGKFELAHRGTIFLDEIGDMPLEMQPKILRVLEEKEFERIGGTRVIKSDFRVIAATNRALEGMMQEGTFRKDLFYRLNVIPLHIPPLRDRIFDIGLLTEKLLENQAAEANMPVVSLDPKARQALMDYTWPGNVRELSNVLERTLSRLDSDTIRPHNLPFYILQKQVLSDPPTKGSLRSVKTGAEKLAVMAALEGCGYNKARAAEKLGIHRTLLYRKMKRYGISLAPEP